MSEKKDCKHGVEDIDFEDSSLHATCRGCNSVVFYGSDEIVILPKAEHQLFLNVVNEARKYWNEKGYIDLAPLAKALDVLGKG